MTGAQTSLRLAPACAAFAWHNLLQHRVRTAAASAGIAFAVLLLFLQAGFLDAARREATLLYDKFNFDIAVVGDAYQFLYSPPVFDRIRLTQARVVPAVADTFNLNIRVTRWTDKESGITSSLLLIGIDDKPAFLADAALRSGLPKLTDRRQVLLDAYSHPDLGRREPGQEAWIRGKDVGVAGQYKLGLFVYAEGSALTTNTGFATLAHRGARDTNIGLIRLQPGSDPNAARAAIAAALPKDIQVLTRAQLIGREQGYFVAVKPLGIMFQVGLVIAFVVGAVLLFQVLSTEVANRMGEYATLKAMGFSPLFVYGIGIGQTLLLAMLAFIPATLASAALFARIRDLTHLPMLLDGPLLAMVSGFVAMMCLASGVITLQRVRLADPAELY